jgi:CubicO group peptidase (beta-lactamase class C family)
MKAFLLMFATLAASAPAESSVTAIASDAEIRAMLVTRVDVQKQATGVVVGVVDPAGSRIVAYGTRALDDQRPVAGDTVFAIGSITKVFTALLLSDMAKRGEVALDDPVAKYLPRDRVTLPTRAGRQISLADLATHTSGLPLRPGNLVSKDPDNKYAGYTIDLLYRYLSSFTLTRDVGSQYEYSNVGYGVLGHALSLASGQSYADLIRTRITAPLGMRDTATAANADMKRRLAVGYTYDLIPAVPWDHGALQAAGALLSSAEDLLKLLGATLGYQESALAPAMAAMLETRRPGGMPPASEIALAWNVYRVGSREIAWKNGSVGGFRAFVGYDPVRRVGVVALANAQTAVGADDIGLHLLDPEYPVDLHTPTIHEEVHLDPAVVDRYVGRYWFSATDVINVTRDGSRLFFTQEPGADKFELFAEGERDFFLKVIDAQITFELSADGRTTSAIWRQAGQDQRGRKIE